MKSPDLAFKTVYKTFMYFNSDMGQYDDDVDNAGFKFNSERSFYFLGPSHP
jgi:hypothetical protein